MGVGGSFLFLFLSCTGHPKEVRIEGEFEHLEQGEFFVYSTDEELDRLDTLRIRDGLFSYRLPATQPATLHILYPNLSELVVFANPGADILAEDIPCETMKPLCEVSSTVRIGRDMQWKLIELRRILRKHGIRFPSGIPVS